MEPGWKGRYRVTVGGQRWWGWHMTWLADQCEGVSGRKEWGAELPGSGKNTSTLRAHFLGATLAPEGTTKERRGQEAVYTFGEEMTLKAAEAFKMAPDEGAARMANCTYHVHTHTGDTWHYAFPRKTAWRVYRPCWSVCGRTTTYQPSPRWQKSERERRERWSRGEGQGCSGQSGPSVEPGSAEGD